MIWPCSFAIAASIVSEAAMFATVGVGRFVRILPVTTVSAIVVSISILPPLVYVGAAGTVETSPVTPTVPAVAKAVAVLALPVKAPTNKSEVIDVKPANTVVTHVAVPAVVVKVSALLVPEIVTLSFRSIVITPKFVATVAAVVEMLLPPAISRSSSFKFKSNGPPVSPWYCNVFAPAALSTKAVVAILVVSLPSGWVIPVVAVFIVPSKSPANVVPVNVPPIVTLAGRLNLTFWAVTAVVTWRAVPSKSNVWLFKRTDDVPVSPIKSKSCSLFFPWTKAVVATSVELSVKAWVVAVEPSGKTTPAAGKLNLIVCPVLVDSIWLAVPNKLNVWLTKVTVWLPPVVPVNVNIEGSIIVST